VEWWYPHGCGLRADPCPFLQVGDGVGPLLVEFRRGAAAGGVLPQSMAVHNALINSHKLQRTWLTVIERSTEAAMKLDMHTNH